jgi:hypothetical protein
MLIVEYTTNGRNVVKVRKDWSPSRIGRAYTPPKPTADKDACRVQTAFIGKGIK